MSPGIDSENFRRCIEAVRVAAPHIKKTPDEQHLLILDGFRPCFQEVFDGLRGVERAEFAVNLWRYGYHRGMYHEAFNLLTRSRAISSQFPWPLRMEAATAMGILCRSTGDYRESKDYLEIAIRAAHLINAPCDEAYARYHIAQTERIKGDTASASEQLELASELACKCEYQWLIACCQNEKGIIAFFECRFQDAEWHFKNALEEWRKAGEERRGLDMMVNLACIAGERGDYATAESYHRKTLSICRNLNDPRMYGQCIHNLGDICIYTQKYADARVYLTESYIQMCAIEHLISLPNTIRSMGMLFFKENDFKRAIRFFGLADYMHEQSGSKHTNYGIKESNHALWTIKQSYRANLISMYRNQGKRISPDDVISIFNAPS